MTAGSVVVGSSLASPTRSKLQEFGRRRRFLVQQIPTDGRALFNDQRNDNSLLGDVGEVIDCSYLNPFLILATVQKGRFCIVPLGSYAN